MREKWHKFFKGLYAVSNKGRVKSLRSGKLLKILDNGNGYKEVQPVVNGKRRHYYVHRLVAKYFIGPCPDGKEVNHKDLDKSNNYWRNLEYKSHRGNIQHALRNGIEFGWHPVGELAGNSKLTWEKIRKIRKLYSIGRYNTVELGKKFGVSNVMIGNIIRGDNWVE